MPHATPAELLQKLDDVANGIDDHGGVSIRNIMHDIIDDIQDSYSLAMRRADIPSGAREEVASTVEDYIINYYGDY